MRTLEGHAGESYIVAFSSNGKRLVSSARDGHVKVWDVETETEVSVFVGVHGMWWGGGGVWGVFSLAWCSFVVLDEGGLVLKVV